ncbi:MAG: UDP-N-acetylmuramoyl-tripeptide--D-alanyl-D-alanine ligase [Aeromicrobium sp.]|uniref:UDP-N-acetylmuramoyl-tripeptide--D-alanyl-D- alanine ligase n=1 Tax=Aeromicrobium sp. TaxID=1871063 RepID=UPI0039E72304
MIALSAARIAEITGGSVHGDPDVQATAPAVIDSRRIEPGGLFVALRGEQADGHDFLDAAASGGAAVALVERVAPSPLTQVVVPDVTVALGRLARAVHDELAAGGLRTVALTGSAGKTSTKDLLVHLLEGAGETVGPEGSFNNEWGVPLTVLRATRETAFLVVEMGARGIGHIATLCAIAPPDVAGVLNVGSAHVGEFGGLDHTARAKGEIVEGLRSGGVAVLNADDARVRKMAARTKAAVLMFGEAADADVRLDPVTLDPGGFPRVRLRLGGEEAEAVVPQLGLHHGPNAAAAVAMAVAAGTAFAAAAERLATAAPRSPHRMARHERADGVVVVDDAYNANPESTRAAVDWLAAVAPGRGVAVFGAMLELGGQSAALHHRLGEAAAAADVRAVVAVGEEAAEVAAGAGERGRAVADVAEAVAAVETLLRPGDVVLVKASRGARLERVVDGLLRNLGTPGRRRADEPLRG